MKYDAVMNDLESLMLKREELKKDELIVAIMNSDKSYDDIMEFLKNDK